MKKIVYLLFLISSFLQAQYTVNGTMTTTLDTDWVILYKIEGSRQKFVQNTTIKKETIVVDGKQQEIGTFSFQLQNDTTIGSYRISYRTKGPGFLDFIFNKENISFTFHPDYPEQTVLFSESEENIIFKNYLQQISKQQQKLDSLQVLAFRESNSKLKKEYKTTLAALKKVQNSYLDSTKSMYVQPFIKATLRVNPSEIKTKTNEYLSNMRATFFNNMDFSNKTLLNSSFLVDRITDYVFYINYSEDKEMQQKLYKESVEKVFSKISNDGFKKDVIEFLIGQFEEIKNLEMIDYLFENYYDTLPESLQNKQFKTEKLAELATEVGRIAPDFSWTENGKKLKLSTLQDADNYVLVFWSAECSHCLKEIPILYKLTQNKNLKVVAFGMETNDVKWKSMIKTLPNWHHVLGLNKWENKTARTYNINATPTYFVLNANKKITAKPDSLEDVKGIIKDF